MLTLAQYAALLARLNGKKLQGIRTIMLLPGMAFGDRGKWWSRGGMRCRPHEGVDLLCCEDDTGQRHFLGAGIQVPCLISGEIIAVCDDLLGKSVFVRGESRSRGCIVAVHAHILPRGGRGDLVAAGDAIGMIAPADGPVPAHLHLSLLRCGPALCRADIDWNYLNKCDRNFFLDPFA